MNEPVFLIDAYSLIYRSYFAFLKNPLRNSKGENVSAIFGFFRTIFQLFRERNPKYLAVVMDSKTPTFRHERYPEYKATREKAPADLHAQIPVVEEILKVMGVFSIRRDGFEADDVIASYVELLKKHGTQSYILSGDKDILQLVGDGVIVLHPERGAGFYSEWDSDAVFRYRGVTPTQIVDYLALAGDQADNIPGVRGIGDKTAVKLLAEFGSLDNIYANIDSVKPESLKKKLLDGRDSAYLSRDLVVLRRDLDLGDTLDKLSLENYNPDRAIPLFAREGMKSLVEELGGKFSKSLSMDDYKKGNYRLIDREEELIKIIDSAISKGIISFDTETTGLDEMEASPVGFSLSFEPWSGYYIPLRAIGVNPIPDTVIKRELKRLFGNDDVKIVGQNIKYDYKVMKRWGVEIKNIYFDTMIAAWLIDATSSSYGMDRLAEKYLNYKTIHYSEIVKDVKRDSIADTDIDKVVNYAGEDADITLRLFEKFESMLKEEGLDELFYKIEMPLVKILSEMELAGIKLLSEKLVEYSREISSKLTSIEEEIYKLCGRPFNINSTKQLQTVLFEWRKLKPVKKTKTGYSTDVNVLKELADQDPVPELVLRHRTLSKLKSTYVDSLPRLVNKNTGRLHTHFIQTGTATGRLSSKDPNLQNIPIREEEGRRIRKAFVAEDGYSFISADYSQIELAVLAYLSNDEMLLRAFKEGRDIHRQTASLIFGVPEGEVTSEMRRVGKTINFGVIYGMSAFRLSRDLKITRGDAERFIKLYFEKYRGVNDFIGKTIRQVEQDGFVQTIMGRKRIIQGINSKNKTEKMAAERVAVNTPIQGSAADIVKAAMVKVYNRLKEINSMSRLILQVHDELILEVPDSEVERIVTILRDVMENAVDKPVPLRVNIEVGKSWGDFH